MVGLFNCTLIGKPSYERQKMMN